MHRLGFIIRPDRAQADISSANTTQCVQLLDRKFGTRQCRWAPDTGHTVARHEQAHNEFVGLFLFQVTEGRSL